MSLLYKATVCYITFSELKCALVYCEMNMIKYPEYLRAVQFHLQLICQENHLTYWRFFNKNKKQMEFTGMVATDVIESRKPNQTTHTHTVMSMKWLLQRASVKDHG